MALLGPGSVVGSYVVESLLGDGGMATVYLVRHAVLGSRHALKVLAPDLLVHEDVRMRFLAEGRIQSGLQHPNVVAVTDLVVEPGIAGLVMEYVEGPTLDAWLARHGRLPAEEATAVLTGVLAGTAAAHSKGVVHRDLKPSNILLGRHPDGSVCPRILDFGIAKVDDGDARGKTRTGTRLGTVHYMSPEQVRGASQVDRRSDVWSLGVILYELLVGRTPFEDVDDFATMQRIDAAQYPPLEALRPDVPPALAGAVRKALQKSPDRRFADCAAFALALRDASRSADVAPSLTRPPGTFPSTGTPPEPPPVDEGPPPWLPTTAPLWTAYGATTMAGIAASAVAGDGYEAALRRSFAKGAAFLIGALVLHLLLARHARRHRAAGSDPLGVDRLWTVQLAHFLALVGLYAGDVLSSGARDAVAGTFFLTLFSAVLASGASALLAGLGRRANLRAAYAAGLAAAAATLVVVWTSPDSLPLDALSTLLSTRLRHPDTLLRVQLPLSALLLLAGRALFLAMAANGTPLSNRDGRVAEVVRTLAWLSTLFAAYLGLNAFTVASEQSGDALAATLTAAAGQLTFHGLWAGRLHRLMRPAASSPRLRGPPTDEPSVGPLAAGAP